MTPLECIRQHVTTEELDSIERGLMFVARRKPLTSVEPEDLVQEVFRRVCQSTRPLKCPKSGIEFTSAECTNSGDNSGLLDALRRLLYKSLHNFCVDLGRRESVERVGLMTFARTNSSSSSPSKSSVDVEFESRQQALQRAHEKLKASWNSLSDTDRRLLTLQYVHGLSTDEMRKETKVKPGASAHTLRSALSRARRRLLARARFDGSIQDMLSDPEMLGLLVRSLCNCEEPLDERG